MWNGCHVKDVSSMSSLSSDHWEENGNPVWVGASVNLGKHNEDMDFGFLSDWCFVHVSLIFNNFIKSSKLISQFLE